MHKYRRGPHLLALVAAFALFAASCSSDSDTDTASGGDGGNGGDAPALPTAEDPTLGGDPVPGGKLVYAVESDTANPWTPQNAVCAISCHMIMRSVFDTLMIANDDAEIEPFLAESMEPNDDFTSWTITARPGITFHDDTPFDGAAIARNLEAHLASPLTGTILRDTAEITSDGMTATITFNNPWVHFPAVLSGQVGYMASPTWLDAVEEDANLAQEPVGTGPFVYQSYQPGAQATFTATKNPDYWIEGLPYLDEIEYRALPDSASRLEGVVRNRIDITHSSGGVDISTARDQSGITLIETADFSETGYVLLNVANPDNETSDVRVRRAMAHAIDRELGTERRTDNVSPVANGPFNPTQIGYLEDNGWPEYDPDEARRLVDEYEAENGPITITVKTTTDPFNAETIELLRTQLAEVGIDTDTDVVPQDAFIVDAVLGNFEAFLWRNHGGTHPDQQNHWWHGDVARSDSPLIINFGRIQDDEIDGHLDTIRRSDDPEVVREAAEAINRRFADQVYNLWNWWTVWGIFAHPKVRNISGMELPSGNMILPFGTGIGGTHWISQIWIDPEA